MKDCSYRFVICFHSLFASPCSILPFVIDYSVTEAVAAPFLSHAHSWISDFTNTRITNDITNECQKNACFSDSKSRRKVEFAS